MTVFRVRDRLKFIVERWLQRGVRTQLLFIAGLIALIATLGGLSVWIFSGQFDHLHDAIWWGFLRLTDPGYLGDDQGALLRTVSTVITVLGYVLFLGSLVAILTQGLNEAMRNLEKGLTPITMRGHILILGWTNRTPTIVQELLISEGRVRRFLSRRNARRLRIVILTEDVAAVTELRDVLGRQWDERRVILRSGTSLRLEHLRRVAYRDAAAIIVPGADYLLDGAMGTDARVIKTLISLSPHERREGARGPSVVAEIFDAGKVQIAEQAYRGGEIDVLASDAFISRLIAQNARHRGLSYLYTELLSHARGNELYVRAFTGANSPRSFTELEGRPFGSLAERFGKAILLGIVRPRGDRFEPLLNPAEDLELRRDDRLVFIARSYDECEPDLATSPSARPPSFGTPSLPTGFLLRRILVLGWNHKVQSLLREFGSYTSEPFEIDILSRTPQVDRKAVFSIRESLGERVPIRHFEGDYTERAVLASMEPATYDNIVFLASDATASGEESDARTILGYVLLRALLETSDSRPEILIELMDPANASLFRRRAGEVIISPLILSHILAHVALRRELSAVFNELFGPGGAEFFFRPARDYDLDGRRVDMQQIHDVVRSRKEISLGVRLSDQHDQRGGGVHLNPPRDSSWNLTAEDEVIVLATT